VKSGEFDDFARVEGRPAAFSLMGRWNIARNDETRGANGTPVTRTKKSASLCSVTYEALGGMENSRAGPEGQRYFRRVQVTFTRTGQRRYRVTADRAGAERVAMDPAPGYDSHLPHDLVHFVVECHWKLRDGIYGQLAAGGDAGTFTPVDRPRSRRWAKRSSQKNAHSGADVARSEKLAAGAFIAWQVRSGRIKPSRDAQAWIDGAEVPEGQMAGALDRLDEVAEHWRALDVGDSLTVTWPWPERVERRGKKPA
jgi:hypothetical protein